MRLFLASSLDKTLPRIAAELPARGRVLFVANAADPFAEQWWVERDREAFRAHSFSLTECDLREQTAEQFAMALAGADVVHVAGGSVLYLTALLRRRQVLMPLIDAVRAGRVVYTGTSAGSMVAAPSVWPCQYEEDDRPCLADVAGDFSGMGLVPFLVMPHANAADFMASNLEAVRRLPEHGVPLLFLYDNQVVAVEDGKWEILMAE